MALKVYYIKWLLLIRDRFTPRPWLQCGPARRGTEPSRTIYSSYSSAAWKRFVKLQIHVRWMSAILYCRAQWAYEVKKISQNLSKNVTKTVWNVLLSPVFILLYLIVIPTTYKQNSVSMF